MEPLFIFCLYTRCILALMYFLAGMNLGELDSYLQSSFISIVTLVLLLALALCVGGIFLFVVLRLGTHFSLESCTKAVLVVTNSFENCLQTKLGFIL